MRRYVHTYKDSGQERLRLRPKKREGALPGFVVQDRIVVEIDVLQAKVDAVKSLQAQAAAELGAMLPAILDKAFRGAL